MDKFLRLFAIKKRRTNESSLSRSACAPARPPSLLRALPAALPFPSPVSSVCSVLRRPTTENPGPIRGNPKLHAETCASGLAGVEKPHSNIGLNGPCNTHAIPPIVAPCCTVLQCVAPCCAQKFFTPQVQHLHVPHAAIEQSRAKEYENRLFTNFEQSRPKEGIPIGSYF